MSYLRALEALPELDLWQEFALMPAEEIGLKWIIDDKDCTETMNSIARRKGQTPMVLISRPIIEYYI